MLNLGGNFSNFMTSLFDFLNQFLGGLFGWLAALLDGITVNFPS